MDRREIAALLAYVDRLAPERAPRDPATAAERVEQWATLLAHVPATAEHPAGPERSWDAAQIAARYLATTPWPIKPADIGAPWEKYRADVVGLHAGTFEPTAHPEIDPDDDTGNAYVTALRAERAAVASGRALPNTHRAITAGPLAADVERRLKTLGSYIPRTVDDVLDDYRPTKAARRTAIRAGRPDALAIACPHCDAAPGHGCTTRTKRRPLRDPHPIRTEQAHNRQEQTA